MRRGLHCLFTDAHAYLQTTCFHDDIADLKNIDWLILKHRDFKRDPEDPGKFERYQAAALVNRHVLIEPPGN